MWGGGEGVLLSMRGVKEEKTKEGGGDRASVIEGERKGVVTVRRCQKYF